MATTTLKLKDLMSKTKADEFIEAALGIFSESFSDMVITIAVTAMTLLWMGLIGNPVAVNLIAGYYIAAMLIILLIRIVRKFEDKPNKELEDRVIELEEKMTKLFDGLLRAVEENDLDFRASITEKIETFIRLGSARTIRGHHVKAGHHQR